MRFIVLLEVPSEGVKGFVDDWRDRRPKDVKILLRPHISAETINGARLLTVVEAKKMNTITDYCRSLEGQGAKVQLISIYDDKSTSRELKKFQSAKRRAERHNRKAKTRKLKGLGSTKNLTVLPLIDWRTNQEGLMVETGVSYIVRTDDNTILFDAGLNNDDKFPSPLLRNMEKLGVTLNEIDTIFITHNHEDHVGGVKWAQDKTFSVTGRQDPLSGVKAYVPTEMTYPGLEPVYARDPMVIGEGVASTGTIASGIYLMGFIEEQSLAVKVDGKGLVLIVGCGHQTVPRLLERARALFDEPIYGIIGGLHYAVMGGPREVYGYALHKYAGTGKPPWEHITVEELNANILLLKGLNLGLIALSPHDSSDVSMRAFRDAFPDAYRNLRVGEPIIVGYQS
jgi:7,8-dihydropterin-6-yl-methyl-4-(beta-D-ribofuranosyl)aminobenzene 5'-phosphate synthase